MKAKEFVGLLPPIPSAFNPDGSVFEQGLRDIVDFVVPHVHGMYPIGSYGCGPLMNLDERKQALEIILDQNNNRVPVIAHVGCTDTKSTIELAKHAKKAGAQAVAAVGPYYTPGLPEENLFRHYAAIIDAVADDDFPVFLYNNVKQSQNPCTPKLLHRLAEYGLGGCKESSFDLVHFHFFQEAVKDFPDFNLIIGTESVLLPAMMNGAKACVCGIANIYPELVRKLYDEIIAKDYEKAVETQKHLLDVREVTKMGNSFEIVNYILSLRGVNAGVPRMPLIDPSDELKAKIKAKLIELGEL